MFKGFLSHPRSSRTWNIQRVTTRAVNMLNSTPRPRVMAKPRTSSVPTQPRIRQVSSVVMLASKIAR